MKRSYEEASASNDIKSELISKMSDGIKSPMDKIIDMAEKAKDNAKQYGADEEAMLKMERPYVGVSEFLAGQRNVENKLYFPEFIPQEYWSRRYHEWAKGNFSDDEIAIFFDGDKSKVVPVPLGNTQDWKENGKLKEDFGTDEQKRLRDLMQDKWEHQAKYGTEIHNVLHNDIGKYNTELSIRSSAQ